MGTECCVNVLAAIGNKVICESLCLLLKGHTGFNCTTNIKNQCHIDPDIVLFNSATTLETLQEEYPEAKFILMDTGLKEQEITYLLFYHKIDGVITPETEAELFFKALGVVHRGQIWIDNKHLKCLLRDGGAISASNQIKSFSRQDRKIVQFVAQGLKNSEIANQLCLSEHTIKAHISRIFKRLNISRRTQLVSLVMECGLDPYQKEF